MPIIEEEELLNLHKEIESQKERANKLRDKYEDSNQERDTLEQHRLILGIVSGVLLLLLLCGMGLYFFSPKTFMSKSKFEQLGYKVMTTQEYTNIEEILNSSNGNSLTEGDLNSTDENEEDTIDEENQESIGGTIIYAVQVAAFEEAGIQLYSNNLIQFSEVRKDDFYKYSLGAFETLEEAQKFRKEIVKLGFNDAFVASYKNGRRLRIEEAY